MMGFGKRKGELVPALIGVMIILGLKAKCCRAALIVKSNTTYECKGNGRLDECRIAKDLELELDNLDFLMNPDIIRILADGSDPATDASKDRKQKFKCPPQGNQIQYAKCIPQSNGGPKPENPSNYNRGRGSG